MMRPLAAGAFAVVLSLSSAPANASTITMTWGGSNCGLQSSSSTTGTLSFDHAEALGPTGSGCNAGTDLVGTADLSATLVQLSASSANPTNIQGTSVLGGLADILDTITITGSTGTGTLVMSIAVNGTLTADETFYSLFSVSSPTFSGTPGIWFACGANSGGIDACPSGWGSTTNVNSIVTLTMPFTFGVATNTQVQYQIGVGPHTTLVSAQTGSGTSQFDSTLLSFVVLDSAGAQIDASVVSDSGFRYDVASPTAAAVPEPGSLILLGTGLLGAAARWRRSRSS